MKTKQSRKEIILSAHSYMWRITKSLHGRYMVYTFIVLLAQSLATLMAMSIGKGLDVLVGSKTIFTITTVTWAIFLISISRCFVAIAESVYHIKFIAYDLDRTIQSYTMGKLFNLSPGQTHRENTGLKVDTLQKGATAVGELIALLFTNIIPVILRIVISMSILFYINWIVASIVLFSIISFIIISVIINNRFVDDVRRVRKIESKLETKFWEVIKNLRLVITMAMQERTFADYKKGQAILFNEGKKVWISYHVIVGLSRNLIFEHGLYAPIMLTIFVLYRNSQITIGDVSIVITLIASIYSSIGSIGTIQRQVMRYSVNVQRLEELVEQEPESADVDDSIELVNPRAGIEFKGVTFSYGSGAPPALKKISFVIEEGKTVALVGHSGCGKSTIISLLVRAHTPQEGEILIDGLPLNSIVIKSWRKRVGMVSQQTMLWDDTVRANVLYGADCEFAPERLNGIIRDARIDEFSDRLGSKGLDTEIGENGIQLSGGQCQRIAIARVLARDPKLIIFDEATSALDYTTEAQVFKAMNNALKGRTGIIIAHRLGTVKHADRIIVLNKGEIVGEGTFDELSLSNEHFKKLIGSEIR